MFLRESCGWHEGKLEWLCCYHKPSGPYITNSWHSFKHNLGSVLDSAPCLQTCLQFFFSYSGQALQLGWSESYPAAEPQNRISSEVVLHLAVVLSGLDKSEAKVWCQKTAEFYLQVGSKSLSLSPAALCWPSFFALPLFKLHSLTVKPTF